MRIKGKTIFFDKPPVIVSSAGVAGKKEGEGPLANEFDAVFEDTTMGEDSYELAESAMLNSALSIALEKAGTKPEEVTFTLCGDLLDQGVASSFAVKDLNTPFIGLFGACSTMALSLSLASMLADAGAPCVTVGASSHFCSSERQFRFPLEYGGQRPPTAQRTVTGCGAAVVKNNGSGVKITATSIGTICDLGITDANNMGAAMAPVNGRIRP